MFCIVLERRGTPHVKWDPRDLCVFGSIIFLICVFQSDIPHQTISYMKMPWNAFILSQFNFWTLFSGCDENIFYFFKRSVHVVNLCSVAYVLPY